MSANVNLWSDAEHATRYLHERKQMPHRLEGYTALLEVLPRTVVRVLDLGCGDGEVTARVLAEHPGATAVACDFSSEMLDRVQARFAEIPAVTVVEHDLDDPLPGSWGRFDAIVSGFAIHHVVDQRKRALYGEIFEHLEPGGTFCNLEHVDSPTPELHEAFLVAIGTSLAEDDPSNKLVAVETQLTWLRELGFEHVDCHWKWREMALLAGVKPVA
jgi:cyclopropane fatty-acyl-phospholipid synthase-like methyltransferase